MKIISTAIVALAISTQAQAICTPATVNPAAIQRIMPRMSVAAVQAVMGCLPTETMIGESGVTLLRFAVPFVNGGVSVAFDVMGSAFAVYLDPALVSYNGAMRVEPPAPSWMPSAGVIPVP